ncbi:type I-F CRISPR-associated endoribonuclease Cas6/Csy4 [Lysobacteraceae bacterium NML08-0793]|nr:type I-F CRISPR-associated endoribonuclease Cas6/Csy4 [Xanthomonadaceae bacterium NML08-0793]
MDAYIEFTLQPDDEFPQHVLMDALVAKLHRTLVALEESNIGISFPGWRDGAYPTLGLKLRLHGQKVALERLMQQDWLRGMRDHLQLTELAATPQPQGWLKVARCQAKSAENMRKRAMRRHGLSAEDVRKRIPADAGDHLDSPFVTLYSRSTGQRYRLYIKQQSAKQPSQGGFNSHGLSLGGCVPLF